MSSASLRVGIVGCGRAARAHLARIRQIAGVEVVALADHDPRAAADLAEGAPTFIDHRDLLAKASPQALLIFTPHRAHYRPAMDALQAGCHVFVEKPLSTIAQEAADIVKLARGRALVAAVGHQYRLRPSLVEARRRILDGAIGPLRLVTATLAAPWLAAHSGPRDAWRLDPKNTGGGILADAGDHMLDTLLWVAGQPAAEVAAFQQRLKTGLDVVSAAALRLADGTLATLGISGVSAASDFALDFVGERGRLFATESSLGQADPGGALIDVPLPAITTNIDADFAAAAIGGTSPCCPAEQAVDAVRLLEAIARSAMTGEVVRL